MPDIGLPGLHGSRPRTSDDSAKRRRRRGKNSPKTQKLPDATRSDGFRNFKPQLSEVCSRQPSISHDAPLPRFFVSRAWHSCARRGCLCGAPPPISTSQVDKGAPGRSSLPLDHIASETPCFDGEGDDSTDQSLFSSEPSRGRRTGARGSMLNFARPGGSFFGHHVLDPTQDQSWAEAAAQDRKKFTTHPKGNIMDRLDRIDQRRQIRVIEKKLQKHKEQKKKRFEALPPKERKHIEEAFEKFDLDNSGELDKDEVVQCLKEFGLSGMTGEETRAIIEVCSDASQDDQNPLRMFTDDDQVVSVGLHDLALTVIPRVRNKLRQMRSHFLFRTFRMYDNDEKGTISMDDCHRLAEELGIDVSIFDECFQAEEEEEEGEEGEPGQEKVKKTTISFEQFQSVTFSAREKATREARQKERQIQVKCDLDEKLFQEFREDLTVLHDLFQRFDYSKNGSLDMLEVVFMIKDFGLLPKDAKERQYVLDTLETLDADGSGDFNFAEFLHVVHHIRNYSMSQVRDELQMMFEHYDRDYSGELSISELSVLLCTLGLVPHTRREQEELAVLIHLVDADGSGLIDFGEFQVLCQRIKENISRIRYESELEVVKDKGFDDEEIHDIRFAFDKLDTSLNGAIDKNEAKSAVGMTGIHVSIDLFEEAYKQLDVDHSGELNFVEFSELMRLLRDREGLFQKDEEIVISW